MNGWLRRWVSLLSKAGMDSLASTLLYKTAEHTELWNSDTPPLGVVLCAAPEPPRLQGWDRSKTPLGRTLTTDTRLAQQNALSKKEKNFQKKKKGGWLQSTASRVSTHLALALSPVLGVLRSKPIATLGSRSLLLAVFVALLTLLLHLALPLCVLSVVRTASGLLLGFWSVSAW